MMVTYPLVTLLESDFIDKVYIVCEEEWKDAILEDAKKKKADIGKISGFAQPGETRQLSILNGLERILADNSSTDGQSDTVLIHDAARPNLTKELIRRCYEGLEGHAGVMPVLPMKDTVYISNDGREISELIDRKLLYAGQAPEIFRLKAYLDANNRLLPDRIYGINGASEPAVLAGMNIAMIPGDERNIKVTDAADLERFVNLL